LVGGGDGWPAQRTRESPCRQATLGLMSAEDYCSLLSRIAANVSEKEVRWQGKEQENRRAGDRRISQLIRYLVALRLARGLPCVRSPRWSWAAIPHASSRVRPPHKSYQHPHLQYLLLGPHEQSWCVCLPCAVSSRHLGLRPHNKADHCWCLSRRLFSNHGLVLLRASILHTSSRGHGMSARALARRQHSRPDIYRSAHCMTFPCSYPL
jgi:hypothetical protein